MINIILAEQINDRFSPIPVDFWSCWLEISQGAEAWMLPATAPGELSEDDLQAYFDEHEAELWQVAQEKRCAVDIFERVPLKRLLKALALVLLDEINILRVRAKLPERTTGQIITAIKTKLRGA